MPDPGDSIMTVTVIPIDNNPYPLKKEDMCDGHAYKSDSGTIYICSRIEDYIAFSVCGRHVISEDSDELNFKEINLEIREV